MMSVDWTATLLGGAAGLMMGALYFAGLAVGMRRALRSANPVGLLSLSAALRIAALLAVGWTVVGQGGPWAGLGYGIAFLITRLIATTFARAGVPAKGAS